LDPTQTYTGSGRLAQVELRIDRRLQPPSPLSFEGIYTDTFLLDGGGKEIPFTAVNGYYECSAHPATKLSVFSAHGLPIPGVGSWLFDEGDGVTCQIAPYWPEGEVVWVCTGWTGTGSVPPNGNGIMVSFFINENSTITWNWQQLPSINTSLAFSRTSYSFVVGEAFNVTAVIKNVKGLGAWQLALSYDPNVIEYRNVSIPSDNIFKGHDVQLMGPDASIPGYVVLGVGATPGDIFSVDGSGVLCTFTFIGRNAGNSSLAFSNFGVDTFLLNTSSLRDIPFMAQGSSARSVMFHGDVDNDGDVNMRDVSEAILAFNSFPGMTRWNPYADLDNSDRVDMRDLVIIVLNFNQHE
jgi:hypothetical protein